MAGDNKFHARRTERDGHTFDSQAEADRYDELRLLQQAGEIIGLELQPSFVLQPSFKYGKRTVRAITYRADFRYIEAATGKIIVEDVKGVETEAFRIKAKMLLYVHKIELRLTRQRRAGRRRGR